MRIVVIGYFHGDASQNGVRIAQSWSRQGHSVLTLDFNLYDHLTPLVKFNPDFVLVTMGRSFSPLKLQHIRARGYYLANWVPDEYGYNDAHGGEWFEKIKGYYNLLMCETTGIIQGLQDNQVADEVIHIPQYFDPYYHYTTDKRGNFQQDLGFLGEANPDQSSVRLKFLTQLAAEGYNLKVGGMRWGETTAGTSLPQQNFLGGGLVNGEMARFYRRTKIGLNFINDHLPDYELALSNRAFKTIGSGCMLLTHELKGLEQLLIPGEHCVVYNPHDYDDLKSKIDYYLKNDEERERIALAGQKHVLANFGIDKVTAGFIDQIKARLR